MPETKQVHKLFKEDDFDFLVKRMDNEESMHELISAVETVGQELREEMDTEVRDIDDISLGWMRIAWEGHHRAARLEGRSFADMLDKA